MSKQTYTQDMVILARGSSCPTCRATPDEVCTARRSGKEVQVHQQRVDRAVAQYLQRHPR